MSRYIGLQQGDPDMTFDRLPTGEAMPELEPGFKLLDLRTTAYQHLMDLSAASAPNPFGELLPFNPGVLPARLGYMTGASPCAFCHRSSNMAGRGILVGAYVAMMINLSVLSTHTLVPAFHLRA